MPVTRLVLARCAHMADADIACMLATLPHLVAVDLSHCHQLSDAAMTMLARYSRDEEGEGADDKEEAAEEASKEAGLPLREQMQQLAIDDTCCLATPRSECGSRGSGVLAAPPATLESPNTAVRRIATQLRSRQAAAAAVQQQRLAALAGLQELRLRGTSITAKGIKVSAVTCAMFYAKALVVSAKLGSMEVGCQPYSYAPLPPAGTAGARQRNCALAGPA